MANDISPEPGRHIKTVTAATPAPLPAEIYQEHAGLLYGVLRVFISEPIAIEAMQQIAQELLSIVPSSGYKKYSKLVCLRAAYTYLTHETRAKSPGDFRLEEAFALVLRDRYAMTCFEIGSAQGVSEGSIRTRLERARLRTFTKTTPSIMSPEASKTGHLCIKLREQIEDWMATAPRLGSFPVPQPMSRAVAECPKCETVLQARLASLTYFQELPTYPLPDDLKAFPVSPLFVKEGKKVLFNWTAAPWYVKALFEGLLATTLVLGIVLSIPRIKSLYEFWLERRLDLYSVAELAAGLGSHADSISEGSPVAATKPETTAQTTAPTSSDPATTNSMGPTPPTSAAQSMIKSETEFPTRGAEKPSSDKVYRVLIKSDAPETLKDSVLQTLGTAQYQPADPDAPRGADLPGGVMFDVFVPLNKYVSLKNELGKLGETKVIETRSKEKGIAGKARVKIWLQRI